MASRRATVVVVALVLLAIGALGAGSTLPPLLEVPGGEASAPVFTPPTQEAEADLGEDGEGDPEFPGLPSLPGWVTDALGALLLFVVVPAVLWAIWRIVAAQLALRRRRARTPRIRFAEPADIVDEEQLAESFADALGALRRGVDVDAAILGCWRRLERLVADAGVVRLPTQTATELTVEVLDRTPADPAALRRLADLYARAAFSGHRLTDDHRDEAVAALETLHASLTGARR